MGPSSALPRLASSRPALNTRAVRSEASISILALSARAMFRASTVCRIRNRPVSRVSRAAVDRASASVRWSRRLAPTIHAAAPRATTARAVTTTSASRDSLPVLASSMKAGRNIVARVTIDPATAVAARPRQRRRLATAARASAVRAMAAGSAWSGTQAWTVRKVSSAAAATHRPRPGSRLGSSTRRATRVAPAASIRAVRPATSPPSWPGSALGRWSRNGQARLARTAAPTAPIASSGVRTGGSWRRPAARPAPAIRAERPRTWPNTSRGGIDAGWLKISRRSRCSSRPRIVATTGAPKTVGAISRRPASAAPVITSNAPSRIGATVEARRVSPFSHRGRDARLIPTRAIRGRRAKRSAVAASPGSRLRRQSTAAIGAARAIAIKTAASIGRSVNSAVSAHSSSPARVAAPARPQRRRPATDAPVAASRIR